MISPPPPPSMHQVAHAPGGAAGQPLSTGPTGQTFSSRAAAVQGPKGVGLGAATVQSQGAIIAVSISLLCQLYFVKSCRAHCVTVILYLCLL